MARWLSVILLAAALTSVGGALLDAPSIARADGERERPWPDEWPIVLPPVVGPLPPEPPPAPPTAAATRSGTRVIDQIGQLRANVRSTRYQHYLAVNERTGTYNWDCSLMVRWVLARAAPASVRSMERLARPRAEDFVRTIERAPTDRFRRGWQRVDHIGAVRPGDVFAWRRPHGFPSRNSGHVGFVVGAPRRVTGIPNAWALRIADATSTAHQNDTRPYPGVGGFGIGTLVFLTDGQGHGTHYGWGGTYSGGYVVTPIVFGRVGP